MWSAITCVCAGLQLSASSGGVLAACRAIGAEGGLAGFYCGLGAASIRVVPMAIVSFGTYEFVRLQYTRLEEAMALADARAQQRHLCGPALQCAA